MAPLIAMSWLGSVIIFTANPKTEDKHHLEATPAKDQTVQQASSPDLLSKDSDPKTSGLAIASVMFAFFSGIAILIIPALICGHMALNKIKNHPDKYKGKGVAITGLVIGYLGIILGVIFGITGANLNAIVYELGGGGTVAAPYNPPVEQLPTTEAELREWLPGTEWHMLVNNKGNSVRRFYPNGVMKRQVKTQEWDEDKESKSNGYRVTGRNKLEFTASKWDIDIDKDFKSYKGRTKTATCEGYYLGRFELK
jgi:hypothetical protein